MSTDDIKFERPGANSDRKGLENTDPVSDAFRRRQELDAEVADASPQARQVVEELRKLEASRLEREERSQARNHAFRVLREKDRLMQKFFSEPSPMPGDPQAKQIVYQTIADQAERSVTEREAYYRDQISREAEANIREVLQRDRRAGHGHGAQSHDASTHETGDHDAGHEREDR